MKIHVVTTLHRDVVTALQRSFIKNNKLQVNFLSFNMTFLRQITIFGGLEPGLLGK